LKDRYLNWHFLKFGYFFAKVIKDHGIKWSFSFLLLWELGSIWKAWESSVAGARCKAKLKYPFSFQSHNEGRSCPSISKDENDVLFKGHEEPKRLDPIEPRYKEHSIAEVLGDCQGEYENQSEIVLAEVGALVHGCVERSMAELLDGLQDRASLLKGVSKMVCCLLWPRTFVLFLQLLYIPSLIWHLLQCSRTRSKRGQIVAKRSVSPQGDRTVDSEDSPESMGSGSSSEYEVSVVFKPPTPPLFSFLLIPYKVFILRC